MLRSRFLVVSLGLGVLVVVSGGEAQRFAAVPSAELKAKARGWKITAEPELEKQTWSPATVSVQRLRLDPEGMAVREFRHAVKQLRKKSYARSLEYLERALAIDPDFAEAHLNRGVAYSGLGNFEGAVTEFERAISIDGQLMLAYSNLALAQLKLGKFELAEEAARAALRRNPHDVRAHYALGASNAARGEFSDETISSLRLASERYREAQRLLASAPAGTKTTE